MVELIEWLEERAGGLDIDAGNGVTDAESLILRRVAAELRAVREAQTTWEVHANEEWVASSDDFSDAMHYAAMYESEGTVTVYRVTRSLVPVGEEE